MPFVSFDPKKDQIYLYTQLCLSIFGNFLGYLIYGLTLKGIVFSLFFTSLVYITITDIEHMIIPNFITYSGIITGLFFNLYQYGQEGFFKSIIGILVGGGIPFMLILAYYYIRKKEGMGMGDVKLLAMIGSLWGWIAPIFSLSIGSFLAIFYFAVLSCLKKGNLEKILPFGPFISLGSIVHLLFGGKIISILF